MGVNKVDVDPVQLDRQADAILHRAPIDELPPPGPQAEPQKESADEESWHQMIPGLTTMLAMLVFPQWGFVEEEQKAFSTAAADVLEHAFPGGMGGRYGCYVRLMMVTAGVTLARFDADTGKFPPIGPRREKPVGPAVDGSAAAGSDTP